MNLSLGPKTVKLYTRTGQEATDIDREYRYSPNLSLTSALDRGGWSTPCPAALPPGRKPHIHFYWGLGKPQGLSSRYRPWLRKISPPLGFDPKTIQAVASHYTYWAIPAHASDYIALLYIKVKVKLSRYRPGVAQGVGRGIALLFHDHGTRRW